MVNRSPLFSKPEVKKAIATIRDALRGALPEGSFGEREAQALAINDEAMRELLGEELQTMSDSFGDEVLVNGAPYKLHEPGTDTYHSLCGPLEVRRPSYRRIGMHNGPIVIALELAAGLVEGATPALAYSVVHGYAQHDMRIHKETLETAYRTPPSRTTLERIAKRVACKAVEQAPRIEAVVRRAEKVPADAVAISIGLDRNRAVRPPSPDRTAAAGARPAPTGGPSARSRVSSRACSGHTPRGWCPCPRARAASAGTPAARARSPSCASDWYAPGALRTG